MQVQLALVADEANVSVEGKLNVMGVFDRLMAAQFPVGHPRMVYVFRLLAEYGDSGVSTPILVQLVDEDGKPLFEANGQIAPPRIGPGEFLSSNQIFALVGVNFPRPGRYKFVLRVGNLPPHETPLLIARAEQGRAEDGEGSETA